MRRSCKVSRLFFPRTLPTKGATADLMSFFRLQICGSHSRRTRQRTPRPPEASRGPSTRPNRKPWCSLRQRMRLLGSNLGLSWRTSVQLSRKKENRAMASTPGRNQLFWLSPGGNEEIVIPSVVEVTKDHHGEDRQICVHPVGDGRLDHP